MNFSQRVTAYFGKFLDFSVALLLLLAAVALAVGFAKASVDLAHIWTTRMLEKAFDILITDVLALFVVVELIKSLADYFSQHRLKLTFIIDAAIVFVVREVMIGLYKQELDASTLIALAIAMFIFGVVRAISVSFSPTNGHGNQSV